jgi:hypothetical protein
VWVVQSRAHTVIGARFRVPASVWGGARGWNADQFGRHRLPPLVRPFGVGNARGGECGVVGTLLGPEGAGPSGEHRVVTLLLVQGRSASHTAVPPRGGWVWWGHVEGVWSYVENCTVDASIFLTLIAEFL